MRFRFEPQATAVTPKDLIRVANRLGFAFRRQSGSHAIYVRESDQVRVVISMHGGDIKRKTLRAIISDLKFASKNL